MSQVCSSKLQKEDFVNIVKEKLFRNCNFRINYPPPQPIEETWTGTKGELTLKDKWFSKRKKKFQCYCTDRDMRGEVKRKNFIKKLKHVYKIDVEDFSERALNEIIMKVKLLEKEKREKKQRFMDRTTTMIGRLLRDQKSKMRESKVQTSLPKILKSPQISETVCIEMEKQEEREYHVKKVWQNYPENPVVQDKDLYNVFTLNDEEENEEVLENQGESQEKPLTYLQKIQRRKGSSCKMLIRKGPPCVSFEKQLECTPKCVVFQDYKKNNVYLQELKITNIGLDTIHCRYLGILVHAKGEGKFPIGVAVRDNIKLRPGLCCSTKIRLCSPDDSSEMECSIVYETRRQKKSREYSWFFVPVSCIPARAIVKVTPLRIIFPTLNWCEATNPENANQLTKLLKIENTGGKGCVCKISDKSKKPTFCEEFGEYGGEDKNMSIFSPICPSDLSEETSKADDVTFRREFYGENYFPPYEETEGIEETKEPEETAETLVNEWTEKYFSTFQFSRKYCIEIPPFSVQQIEVRFIPKYKGFHHEMKYVQFEGCYNIEEVSKTGSICGSSAAKLPRD